MIGQREIARDRVACYLLRRRRRSALPPPPTGDAGEDQGGGCRDRPKKKSNAAHRTFTSAATTSSNSWAPNCRNGLPFTTDVGVARVSVVCISSARSEERRVGKEGVSACRLRG